MNFKNNDLAIDGWKNEELNSICDVIDSLHKTPQYSTTGYPMIRVKDLYEGYFKISNPAYVPEEVYEEFSKKYKPKLGDILFSRVGSYGIASFVNTSEAFCLGQNTVGISNFCEDVYNKFVYYSLISPNVKKQIEALVTGSTQKTISMKSIKSFKIAIPPLQEQKAIAHILSTLDDKIEVNNQINKTLENMAQAIFKQWFVDFEFPNEDGEPYKSSGGEMIESELGMIPKGWEVEEIGNISDIQNGFAFKAPEYVDEGVKVLRTLNIGNDGYFNNTDIVFLPQSYKSEKYEKYYFEEFDVALVMVGASIGKIGMILKNTAGGLQNQNMWRFRRKEKRVSQIFIYYTVKQAQNISKNWSTGSARDFYRKDSFRKINVILPEKRIMDLFEKITKPIFQNISNHVCENDELISMRNSLLPKLMSGEIRVPLD